MGDEEQVWYQLSLGGTPQEEAFVLLNKSTTVYHLKEAVKKQWGSDLDYCVAPRLKVYKHGGDGDGDGDGEPLPPRNKVSDYLSGKQPTDYDFKVVAPADEQRGE